VVNIAPNAAWLLCAHSHKVLTKFSFRSCILCSLSPFCPFQHSLFCCYSVIIIITNDSCSFIHVTALFYRPMHYNRTVEIDSNCAVRLECMLILTANFDQWSFRNIDAVTACWSAHKHKQLDSGLRRVPCSTVYSTRARARQNQRETETLYARAQA